MYVLYRDIQKEWALKRVTNSTAVCVWDKPQCCLKPIAYESTSHAGWGFCLKHFKKLRKARSGYMIVEQREYPIPTTPETLMTQHYRDASSATMAYDCWCADVELAADRERRIAQHYNEYYTTFGSVPTIVPTGITIRREIPTIEPIDYNQLTIGHTIVDEDIPEGYIQIRPRI